MASVELLISSNRYAEAAKMLEDKLSAVRASGNRAELVAMLGNLGICWYECNQRPEARAALEEALALSRAAKDRRAVGRISHELSMVVAKEGHIDQAIDMCKEALEIYLDAGDDGALPLHTLSVFYQEVGRYAEALEVLLLVREGCESRHDLAGLGKCLNEMGLVYWNLGDVSSAVRCMVDSIELKHRIGNVRGIQVTTRNLFVCLRQHPQVMRDLAIQADLQRLQGILQ